MIPQKILKQLITVIAIIISISLFSCSGDDSSTEATTKDDSTIDLGISFISGNINGESFNFKFDTKDPEVKYILSSDFTGFNGNGDNFCETRYGTTMTSIIGDETIPTASIDFNKWYIGECGIIPESNAFGSLFPIQSYKYISNDNDRGIVVYYTKNNNLTYTSLDGSNNNATFEIISSEKTTFSSAKSFTTKTLKRTIEGTFSCEVVNTDDPNDKLQITDGKFKLDVESFNGEPIQKINTSN